VHSTKAAEEKRYGITLEVVQDALFELDCNLFPECPAADFIAWAGLLGADAIARPQEHYQALYSGEKAAVDVSDAWCHNDAVEEVCQNEELAPLREALKEYEREALDAVSTARGRR
jgi:hypothetical protein